MTDSEIRRGIDRIIDNLRAEVAKYAQEAGKFEALADGYWKQLCVLTHERDALQARLDGYEARALQARLDVLKAEDLGCRNPACQVCQAD